MNRANRRSMGTKKMDTKPQRASNAGLNLGSAAKKSKLPKPSSAVKNSRSGSIEPPNSRVSANLGLFKTPRSKSNSRTPTSSRQPLTNLQVNSAIRSSLSGKRSSIYGSSSNQIKDQRPISDKNWQNDVIRKLVDFCHENDYKNKALTFKDFRPMSTMTFRSIIEFLYGFLEPGFVLPSHAECPLHEALTELLKKLEYRGTVSKSHLQTLGGPSWGPICGVLDFFLSYAKDYVTLSFDKTMFLSPELDNEGFYTENPENLAKFRGEIEFDFFMNGYKAFNKGAEEFYNEERNLELELMEYKKVDDRKFTEKQKKLDELNEEIRNAQEGMIDLENLELRSLEVVNDIKGIIEFIQASQINLCQKQESLKGLKDNNKLYVNKIREKQENIQLLEAECKDRGIFEDKNEENLALKNRVAHKKKEIEEYEKIIWQLEQKISKKVASADKIQCEINKILIQLDLTNLKNCDSSEMMKYSIENLIENTQEDLKKLQIANENFRQNLSDYKKAIETQTKELSKLESQENKFKAQKMKNEDLMKREEEELMQKVQIAKEKVANFVKNKHQVGSDIKEKEAQLQKAEQDLKNSQKQLKLCKEEGKEVLENLMKNMQKNKETELKKKNEAWTKYYEYDRQLSAFLDTVNEAMEKKLANMKKVNFKK